ncbi:hypothetical protein DSO57_1013013, partial [Entomophthora muscae]
LIPPPFGLPGNVGNNLLAFAETLIFIVVESLVLFHLNLLPNSHRASCIPHKKWVQEASKCLYEAAANWFATWVGSQTDKQLDNWEKFKANIKHNFHVTESLQDIAIQLSNLSHKTTVTAYANEFKEIRQKFKTQHKLTMCTQEPHLST